MTVSLLQDRYLLASSAAVVISLILLMTQFGAIETEDLLEVEADSDLGLYCILDSFKETDSGTVAEMTDMDGNQVRAYIPDDVNPPSSRSLCQVTGRMSDDGGIFFIDSLEIVQIL